VRKLLTGNFDSAGVGCDHPQQHEKRGGLSGPVGTKQTDPAPGSNSQIEVIDSHRTFEDLDQAASVYIQGHDVTIVA
jgi:hypothetical protein